MTIFFQYELSTVDHINTPLEVWRWFKVYTDYAGVVWLVQDHANNKPQRCWYSFLDTCAMIHSHMLHLGYELKSKEIQ